MKAAVCTTYGPPEVVQIQDVPTPAPGDGEVLIRAAATCVNSGDARLRAMNVPRGMRAPAKLKMGLRKLRQPILGFEMAGRIDAVGPGVSGWQPGERVVGSRGLKFGCHAEFAVVSAQGTLVKLPESLGERAAVALCFGGSTALFFFQRGKLAAGESVLINGASGAVGAMAVQLAKHAGAEVMAVCSAANADLVRSLGADHVVDYNAEDFARNGRRYDIVMDTHGNAPYKRIKESLKPGGRFLMVVGDLVQTLAASRQKATIAGTPGDDAIAESYRTLMGLAEQGAIKPVIDAALPFTQIVDAHRRVDSGRKVGSLVLTF